MKKSSTENVITNTKESVTENFVTRTKESATVHDITRIGFHVNKTSTIPVITKPEEIVTEKVIRKTELSLFTVQGKNQILWLSKTLYTVQEKTPKSVGRRRDPLKLLLQSTTSLTDLCLPRVRSSTPRDPLDN